MVVSSLNIAITMSLTKFQLCLNHENPSIVLAGLNDFANQVFREHNFRVNECLAPLQSQSIESIESNELYSNKNLVETKGILLSYMYSSPKAEELFVLWSLPGRDSLTDLAIAHTHCLTVILHCSTNIPIYQKEIISKIINDYAHSIILQLGSKSSMLVQVTLGLLTEIVRSPSSLLTYEVYERLLSDTSVYNTILAPSMSEGADSVNATTDTLQMLIIMIFTLYNNTTDEYIISNLLQPKSILKQLLLNTTKYSKFHMYLIIHSLLSISPTNQPYYLLSLLDKTMISDYIKLYNDSNEKIVDIVHRLFVSICTQMYTLFNHKHTHTHTHTTVSTSTNTTAERGSADLVSGGAKQAFGEARVISTELLSHLQPSVIDKRKEVSYIDYIYYVYYVYTPYIVLHTHN